MYLHNDVEPWYSREYSSRWMRQAVNEINQCLVLSARSFNDARMPVNTQTEFYPIK